MDRIFVGLECDEVGRGEWRSVEPLTSISVTSEVSRTTPSPGHDVRRSYTGVTQECR